MQDHVRISHIYAQKRKSRDRANGQKRAGAECGEGGIPRSGGVVWRGIERWAG